MRRDIYLFLVHSNPTHLRDYSTTLHGQETILLHGQLLLLECLKTGNFNRTRLFFRLKNTEKVIRPILSTLNISMNDKYWSPLPPKSKNELCCRPNGGGGGGGGGASAFIVRTAKEFTSLRIISTMLPSITL